MPMFGIYYIPPADSAFYRIASQIMGYDVRSGELLPEHNDIRQQFDRFEPEWAIAAQEFGFHATIGHVMQFEQGDLLRIENDLEAILNLFDPNKPFILTPVEEYIHLSGSSLTAYYHANQAFLMFHAMVVARLHPYGKSTPLTLGSSNDEITALTTAQQNRVKEYLQYYILDDWFPHLRFLGRYTGENLAALRDELLTIIPPPEPLKVESICIVVKKDSESHFKLHREFMRSDFPRRLQIEY
jgi:hypothetical protein